MKFRAWDNMKLEWFDRDTGELYIELDDNINFGWNGEIMDDYTGRIILMQSTDFRDINGIEIYEGDIVTNNQDTYLVRFGEFTDSDDYQYPALLQTGFYLADIHNNETYPFYSTEYKIVGNMYENKELLED